MTFNISESSQEPGYDSPAADMVASPEHTIFADITGPIVIIGFGSIGRGTLPLIQRHFRFDKWRLTIIDPNHDAEDPSTNPGKDIRFIKAAVTTDNYRDLLVPLLTEGTGQGFCVNLSVDTGSVDLMRMCREHGVLYIDTVIEPWLGFYFDDSAPMASRTNHALRETLLAEKRRSPGGTTAVSTCGANPGMVSWFAKQALLNVAQDIGLDYTEPSVDNRKGWADLMRRVGVKGIHIAERDTQTAKRIRPPGTFWNTWSVEGCLSEGMQPAELGWGTHEKWMPPNGRLHDGQQNDCAVSMYLEQPGADTRVRTWCPTLGAQYGLLLTHNESISIADFFTQRNDSTGQVEYRPTVHYAYHPCNDALLSLREHLGSGGTAHTLLHVLEEHELGDGIDELGVLLYGHSKNAYWYGSQLSLEEARRLAPDQNATGLQVTSAVIAGMVWALENPEDGIVEADEMDYKRCLEVQGPYLGPVKGYYTEWTPLTNRSRLFPEDLDEEDPWQFKNVLVR